MLYIIANIILSNNYICAIIYDTLVSVLAVLNLVKTFLTNTNSAPSRVSPTVNTRIKYKIKQNIVGNLVVCLISFTFDHLNAPTGHWIH